MSVDVNNVNGRRYSEAPAVSPKRSPKTSAGSTSGSSTIQSDAETDALGLSAEGKRLLNSANSSSSANVRTLDRAGANNSSAIEPDIASANTGTMDSNEARVLASLVANQIRQNPPMALYAQASGLPQQVLSLLFG